MTVYQVVFNEKPIGPKHSTEEKASLYLARRMNAWQAARKGPSSGHIDCQASGDAPAKVQLTSRCMVPVSTFEQAAAAWNKYREESGRGVSQMERGAGRIFNAAGACIAWVSYNGRVWNGDPIVTGFANKDEIIVEKAGAL